MAFPCTQSNNPTWAAAKTCLQNNLFFGDLTTKNTNDLNQIRSNFSSGNTLLNNLITNAPTGAGLQALLTSIGEKQIAVDKLKNEIKTLDNDIETAEARQQNTAKPIKKTSFYESISGRIGFTKPLHTISISILIAIGLFLLFTSGLLLKEYFKPVQGNLNLGSNVGTSSFQSVLEDPRFYAVASGFSFVAILIGGLAYMGYLGKK